MTQLLSQRLGRSLNRHAVGRFLHEGAPVRVGAAVTVRRAAPLLGADTDDVLRDVAGYPPATIARLRADGVLT